MPAYVRRAEDFMRAHCAEPIRITHVASAAGCSVRTLGAVFRHFRGRTPLAALYAARLEQMHAELSLGATGAPVGTVARCYGFTNSSRFIIAFRHRFGEAVGHRAARIALMTLLNILIGLAHAKDSAIGGLDSPGGSIVWHVIGSRCQSAAGRCVRAGQDGACWLRISGSCRASALRGLQQHDARSPSQKNLQHAERVHCVVKSQRA
jgi:AraC-like DNA-binding protein